LRFYALPVESFEDITLDFDQLQALLTSPGSQLSISTINGVTVPLPGTAWISLTSLLVNAWANTGTGENAAYLKDPLGFVHLIGRLAGGATGTTAFTLPAGYRPGGTQTHPAATFNGAAPINGGVAISSAGVVNFFYAAGATDLSISGITFLAEN
jgi:hypothetical protein